MEQAKLTIKYNFYLEKTMRKLCRYSKKNNSYKIRFDTIGIEKDGDFVMYDGNPIFETGDFLLHDGSTLTFGKVRGIIEMMLSSV